MILISHRGNLNGPEPAKENTEKQISLAISLGYEVEVDVWVLKNKIYLGHDAPAHESSLEFLKTNPIWAHAKNLDALELLLNNDVHCFWHESDERTLTSKNFVWTYPNKKVCKKSVLVFLEEKLSIPTSNIYGICGDYVASWKKEYSGMF